MVHLHVHSEYSALDGVSPCSAIIERAAAIGSPAVALTDHDGVYGMVDFCHSAYGSGVRPIVGAELRFLPDLSEKQSGFHITALAATETGYHNLCQLVTRAHHQMYRKPRVSLEQLLGMNEGIVLLSGCWFGYISQYAQRGEWGEVWRITEALKAAYGERFVLEYFNYDRPAVEPAWAALQEVAARTRIPLVATCDAHFAAPSDWAAANLMRKVQMPGTTDALSRKLHMASAEDLAQDVPAEYIKMTDEVAAWCQFQLDLAVDEHDNVQLAKVIQRLPRAVAEGQEWDAFTAALLAGWNQRMGFIGGFSPEAQQAYYDRVSTELEVFRTTGLAGYMLIVADICDYCRDHGILIGPGRGSAAGSLVSFLLGITSIDPLAAGLYFERFLDARRATMPDVDVDFEDERRDRAIRYIESKYGSAHVGKIITFSRLMDKQAFKDVATKVLGVEVGTVEDLNKLLVTLDDLPDPSSPDPKVAKRGHLFAEKVAAEPRLAEALELAKLIKGRIRQVSVHAAGVVIAPFPMSHVSPTQPTASGNSTEVIQFDMHHVEQLGLLKIDVLALRTLSVARRCIEHIKRLHDVDVDWYNIPVDDPQAYAAFKTGQTTAVFQLEQYGMQEALRKIGADSLMDLAVVIAMYRPGPMEYIDDFAAGRMDPNSVVYEIPEFVPILSPTYGVFVFQEQVIAAFQALGFSFTEADQVRRGMGKKVAEVVEKARLLLRDALEARGYSPELSELVSQKIKRFSGYAFNKSHATAYAVISARMMWLKCHYPAEFMAAALSSMDRKELFAGYVSEVARLGLRLLPPDINKSEFEFLPERGAVRFGLAHVRGIGDELQKKIPLCRGDNTFADPAAACRQFGLNSAQLSALLWSGAFDSWGYSRSSLSSMADKILGLARVKRGTLEALTMTWEQVMASAPGLADAPAELTRKEMELLECSPTAMLRDAGVREKLGPGTMPIGSLVPGMSRVTTCGKVQSINELESAKEGKPYVEALLGDGTGIMRVLAFRDRQRQELVAVGPGKGIVVSGNVKDNVFFLGKVVRVDASA